MTGFLPDPNEPLDPMSKWVEPIVVLLLIIIVVIVLIAMKNNG